MIQHLVMWKFKEELTPFEKEELALEFKCNMENLGPIIDGILKMEVKVKVLDSSNMDIVLVSAFASAEALKQYQDHPKHKEATQCLKKMVSLRSCVDYEGA